MEGISRYLSVPIGKCIPAICIMDAGRAEALFVGPCGFTLPMLTEVNKSRLTLNPSVRSLFPVRVLQHFLASVQT